MALASGLAGSSAFAEALAEGGVRAAAGGVQVHLPSPGRGVALHVAPTRRSGGRSAGGIVIVPAAGGRLELTGSALALQVGLPGHGWHTLAVPLPEVEGGLEPWHRRVAAQIAGGVRYLAGLGIRRVVVVAHGAAAGGAARYFRDGADPVVVGFVGISPVYPARPGADAPAELTAAWPRQVLEIYAELDLPVVRRLVAVHRRQAASLPHLGLRQIQILAARHGLVGYDGVVLKRVRGWLRRSLEEVAASGSAR